ncbi:pupal cuticle protein Edg-84A-like [Onthophagus taurus]|uniref:pupal cuticle protein Edg-84A-like n=1 Tax=Onthophagus taurus TaxID=166361 RepID=UPI000C203B7A|nr:uncharacterized protein LOC111418343 [Onthophagus taurus]
MSTSLGRKLWNDHIKMDLAIIILSTLYGIQVNLVSTEVITSNERIKVEGYIYHPQYYYSYEILPLPPYIEQQLYIQEQDYLIGHYNLKSGDGKETVIDYAGEPVHGFHAVVSGSEVHAALAAVLAKTLKFGGADANTNEQNITLPNYQVPVINTNDMELVGIQGKKKKFWVPHKQHAIVDGLNPSDIRKQLKRKGLLNTKY